MLFYVCFFGFWLFVFVFNSTLNWSKYFYLEKWKLALKASMYITSVILQNLWWKILCIWKLIMWNRIIWFSIHQISLFLKAFLKYLLEQISQWENMLFNCLFSLSLKTTKSRYESLGKRCMEAARTTYGTTEAITLSLWNTLSSKIGLLGWETDWLEEFGTPVTLLFLMFQSVLWNS